MDNIISIIVPVYNVKAYLPECIDGILNQSYDQLEVILIDDGSTDESGRICDEYAQKDRRIKVIHQSNGGAAAAKNAGLQAATGKYLSFVDSDDFLEPGAYAHMVRLLQENDADVVQCSYRDVFQNRTVDHPVSQRQEKLDAAEFLTLFTKDWTCALLWDKLYKRSLFDGVLFETGHKIDDEYFTYRGIMNAGTIIRDDYMIYNYRKRASSVMFSPTSARQIVSDRIDYLSKRRTKVIARFPQLREAYDNHFLNMMIILSRDADATAEHIQTIRQSLNRYFQEPGHTRPDYHLLPALAKLRFCRADRLLQSREQNPSVDDIESFFE